jgi:hypothetical protein
MSLDFVVPHSNNNVMEPAEEMCLPLSHNTGEKQASKQMDPAATELFHDDSVILTMLQLTVVAAACWIASSSPRNSSCFDQHLCWDKHCEKHACHGSFEI